MFCNYSLVETKLHCPIIIGTSSLAGLLITKIQHEYNFKSNILCKLVTYIEKKDT